MVVVAKVVLDIRERLSSTKIIIGDHNLLHNVCNFLYFSTVVNGKKVQLTRQI